MKVFIEPSKETWPEIIKRPALDNAGIREKVEPILEEVRQDGDMALRKFSLKFDGVELEDLQVCPDEITIASVALSNELKIAILKAANNIETFHAAQLSKPAKIATMPGVECWRKPVGIEKVGIYIPGGTAPLFSTVLMLAIPAKIAGCKEIVLCSPPQKNGSIHPAVLYAASVTGVSTIIKAGGAHAIAAMAYGTATVPKVFKIFGPGNQYVTTAKMLVQQDGVAIDMPAGPSEICVMADDTAIPAYVAADLLSQAEHGVDSQVLLVCTSETILNDIQHALKEQLQLLPRQAMATEALENSRAIVMENVTDAIRLVNDYAAEHLIICMKNAEAIAESIINAGSIFIGNYSPESVGDYASGTNHTLPTNGFAAMYSGVSVDSFLKKITIQQLSREGLEAIAPIVIAMAEAEGLEAHANAVKVRLTS